MPQPSKIVGMDDVEVVVAHPERATLRAGDVYLKIDTDQHNTDVEVEAMALAPVPTPKVLWRRPPVLALAALRGAPIARLGQPSTVSAATWRAAGAAIRRLHEAPVPPWPGPDRDAVAAQLDRECAWLTEHEVLPAEVVTRHRAIAALALRPRPPVFVHGDLHVAHVFVADEEVSGILDWSEAGPGDPHNDLGSLTLVHREHLDDVLAGYGGDADRDLIQAWWSLRSLRSIRWLIEHGYDPAEPGGEIDVLRSTG